MKNLKYWETVFETKISKFRLPERLNQRNQKNTIENLNTQISTYSGNGVLHSTHLTKILSSKFR